MPAPYWINTNSEDVSFPDINLALREPDGLLAIGGDLNAKRLISAYQHGVFPWYSGDQPILWWSPDPRFVLFPEQLKISRSLKKTIRKQKFEITINKDFNSVIEQCSSIPRPGQDGTWITNEMKQAYIQLNKAGIAYSVEAWENNQLVGGLYGIALGSVFFGESMFSNKTDASKVAFSQFVQHLHSIGFKLIDCQIYTEHLESLGAKQISRHDFSKLLKTFCQPEKHTIPIGSQTIKHADD